MIVGEQIDLRPIAEGDLDRLEAWIAAPEYAGAFNAIGLTRPGTFRAGFARDGHLTDDRGTLLIITKAGESAGDFSYRVSHREARRRTSAEKQRNCRWWARRGRWRSWRTYMAT